MHRAHRLSACLIAGFVVLHLSNHLLAMNGIAAHIHAMDILRQVYRNRIVETILLACVAFQVGSGVYFVRARWGQRRGFYDRLQAISGGYLAYFLLIHVAAVMFGRAYLGLDTNFYYAAAGMHIVPFTYYFVPYYFLAVLAIFGHLACAMHWLARERLSAAARNAAASAVLVGGIVVAALIVAAFSGAFYPVNIPQQYRTTYA